MQIPETRLVAVADIRPERAQRFAQEYQADAYLDYHEHLADLPLARPTEACDTRHVYHQFVVRTDRRDALRTYLGSVGIGTGIHYPLPLHLQPALHHLGHKKGHFPVTERAANTVLSLPIFPELTQEQFTTVASAIREFFTD